MESVTFTREELEALPYSQLRKLIFYYNLDVPGRSKFEYINALDAYYRPAIEDVEPRYSVRLKRIMEANDG